MKIGDPAAWAEGAAAFICTALIAFGLLIIVLSHGFFMNLLGAGTAACGGAAASPISSWLNDDLLNKRGLGRRRARRRLPRPRPIRTSTSSGTTWKGTPIK